MKTNRTSAGAPRPGYGPSPTAHASRRRAHLSTPRASILDLLVDQPEPCTVAALSSLTRQHPNTIREHLDSLLADRLVVRSRADAQGRGRPAWLYAAAPEVRSEPGSREYAALASALAGQITRTSRRPGADAAESGREWGRELAQKSRATQGQTGESLSGASYSGTGTAPRKATVPSALAARREVVTLLDDLGFAPTTDARVRVVKLHHCPLLEAAHRHPDVVCGVHLGLVRGALEEMGYSPDKAEAAELQPFSEPGACRLVMFPSSPTR